MRAEDLVLTSERSLLISQSFDVIVYSQVSGGDLGDYVRVSGGVIGSDTEETLVWDIQGSGGVTSKLEGARVRRDRLSQRAGGGGEAYRQRHLVIKSGNEGFLDNLRVIGGCTPIETRVGRSGHIYHRASKKDDSKSEVSADKSV